jgi:hypothetical protein
MRLGYLWAPDGEPLGGVRGQIRRLRCNWGQGPPVRRGRAATSENGTLCRLCAERAGPGRQLPFFVAAE